MRLDIVPYMTWAKETFHKEGIHDLGTSGIVKLISPEELGIGSADYPTEVSNDDGLPALRAAIARRHSVPVESVLAAEGTSLANFLVLAALLRPGDAVILEEPFYDPIFSVLQALGARIARIPVDGEGRHEAILDHLSRRRGGRIRAVVVTNPHNPTGRAVGDDLLKRIATACEADGATLLVDEVYREVLFENPIGCAARLHPSIVTTGSLTKVYGLSHLRIGWAIGPSALIARATRLNDNLGVVHPWITEAIGARILTDDARMDRWRTRARARVDANRASVARLLDGEPRFDGALPTHGILSFIRWRGDSRFPDAETLCRRAMEEADICLVPGRFFQRPDFIRIGAGAPEADVAAACGVLARYLQGG